MSRGRGIERGPAELAHIGENTTMLERMPRPVNPRRSAIIQDVLVAAGVVAFIVGVLLIARSVHAAVDGGPAYDASMRLPLPAGDSPTIADATDPDIGAAVAIARAIIDAARHKHWRLLVALCLSVLVFGLKWLGTNKAPWPWLRSFLTTDRGGAALLFLTAVVGALSTLLLAKAAVTVDVVIDALVNAVMAAGGYTLLKRLVGPGKKAIVIAAGDGK